MQLSPILLVLVAAAAVIATPAPIGEKFAERTPEAPADLEDRSNPYGGNPDWKRGNSYGGPDWERDE